jgi:hypothetical protein
MDLWTGQPSAEEKLADDAYYAVFHGLRELRYKHLKATTKEPSLTVTISREYLNLMMSSRCAGPMVPVSAKEALSMPPSMMGHAMFTDYRPGLFFFIQNHSDRP